MKQQKGITLIALIITIIVMLILVGVSVTVALNGGLFETAKKAADDTKAEGEKERLLSIALGTLNDKGIVEYEKLEETLGEDFTGTNGTYTSTKTGITYKIGERGSITIPLTWMHADANSNEIFDVGEVVTASNGESFYVIETPSDDAAKVKLLAAKCVDTSYNKQNNTYNGIAFDEGEWEQSGENCYKPDGTTPVTNVYTNASIKGLVDTYVTETLGLTAGDGRLMSHTEAITLWRESHTDILYGTEVYWSYWIDAGGGGTYFFGEYVDGPAGVNTSSPSVLQYDVTASFGLRPVIEISKSAIQ